MCHGTTEEEAYRQLCLLVAEEVEELRREGKPLPPPNTRPMREAVPTLEHTWFPGHAWSFCLCGRCRMHLGWYYAGPNHFAGLIRDRIVRAAVVMN